MYSRPFTFAELYNLLSIARYGERNKKYSTCEELARRAMERRITQRREHLGKRAYDLGKGNTGCDFHPSKGRRQARKDRRNAAV